LKRDHHNAQRGHQKLGPQNRRKQGIHLPEYVDNFMMIIHNQFEFVEIFRHFSEIEASYLGLKVFEVDDNCIGERKEEDV
jgi:hypothetical protein